MIDWLVGLNGSELCLCENAAAVQSYLVPLTKVHKSTPNMILFPPAHPCSA